MVSVGAEVGHGAAEQPPLHAGLDQQRQVGVGEHLERGHRGRRRRRSRRATAGKPARAYRLPASSRICSFTRSRCASMLSRGPAAGARRRTPRGSCSRTCAHRPSRTRTQGGRRGRCWSWVLLVRSRTAVRPARPDQVLSWRGQLVAGHGGSGDAASGRRRRARARRRRGPRAPGRCRVAAAAGQAGRDERGEVVADRLVSPLTGSSPTGPVEKRVGDDEPVDLGVALDQGAGRSRSAERMTSLGAGQLGTGVGGAERRAAGRRRRAGRRTPRRPGTAPPCRRSAGRARSCWCRPRRRSRPSRRRRRADAPRAARPRRARPGGRGGARPSGCRGRRARLLRDGLTEPKVSGTASTCYCRYRVIHSPVNEEPSYGHRPSSRRRRRQPHPVRPQRTAPYAQASATRTC